MKYFVAILLFILPTKIVGFILSAFKYKKIKLTQNKIGFSFILVEDLSMYPNAKIGHFNIIICSKMILRENSKINHPNFIRGNFSIELHKNSWINNQNKISSISASYHKVDFILQEGAAIGVKHLLDLTDSITIGKNSMLTGSGTQIWTHNYIFSIKTNRRIREDAPVIIGDKCNIGSRCTITAGVKINNYISIGAHTCITKSLTEPGLYVGQALRYIPFDADRKIEELGEPIYKDYVYRRKN